MANKVQFRFGREAFKVITLSDRGEDDTVHWGVEVLVSEDQAEYARREVCGNCPLANALCSQINTATGERIGRAVARKVLVNAPQQPTPEEILQEASCHQASQ